MQPTATSARRILQVIAVKPPDASVSTPPTANLCTAASERKDSSKPSLLTTVWLDADASTYEALCTAGATAITVATPTDSVDESTKEHASSAASKALQLIPQECLTRKRPRVHYGDATTSASISGCGSARSMSSLTLPTGDTDARLDVLEEVELCSIVPRLSRTFGVEQLVQQLVPCTAFFESGVQPAKDGVGEEEERVRGSSASGSSSCLARLRAAADRHMWLLHTAGGGPASWSTPSPTAAASAVSSAGSAGTAVCDGEEDRETPRLQHTSHCVNTWLPPVPSCMRGTSLDATAAPPEARADAEGEEDAPRGAGGEGGNSGASASASAPPPRVSAPPRPVRRLHLGSLGTPGVLSSTQQQNSAGEGDRYDRASGSELCLSFAAAQARYEAQREIQTASPLFAPRSCPTTRDNTATTATATSIMLPPSPADTQRGSGGEDEATAHATADASSNASTDKEPERRQDTALAAAAARLLASTATYFHPHPPSDSFHTFASFALPDVAFKTDTLRHKASPHQRGEDAGALLSGPESAVAAPAAEFDGPSPPSFSSSSPSSSSALLSITHPAGAVVEWVSGGVSYTADTVGLMQEQQARAQRNICLPPPAPSTATSSASFRQRKGDGAEDRTSLRGAVLAQLQRLRRHNENIRTARHKDGARDAATFATRSASISVSNDHIATAQDALCSSSALPCPCVRCSPLQLQFAQVPAMASATLRHYVELLHQSALPSLEHPFPPPRHLRTPNTSLVATKEARAPHDAVDPLDAVFISLRRWCELDAETEAQRGAQRGKWTTAGAAKTEAVKEEEEKRGEEPPVQPRRQHVVRMGRPRKEQPAKLDTTTPTTTSNAAQAGSMSAPLGGIDDAVLDETVMVGVVPRGRPHQLRLVAPSRAFVLTLMQRLEEVVEVAVHILDHLSCPFRLARRETQEAWRAWLVEKYTASVWHTLETALTVREWNMAAQLATQLPFFSPPLTTPQPSHPSFELPSAFASNCTAEEKARVVSVARSVCAAAREHTRACLSAAEDITARVILTALTPLLHRRITVMYELLRHSATPSLYASHRAQCEAYQQWYAATPSPQAVLRLLQRSERLRHALARCYPQYALLPTSTVQGQAQQAQQPQVGGGGAGFSFFPAWPLTASTAAGGRRRGRKAGATSRDATNHTTPPLKRRPGRPRRDAAKNTVVKTEQTDGVDEADVTAATAATATVHPPLVPLSPSPTSSAASASLHNGDAFSSSPSSASILWSPAATYSTAHHPAPHSSPSSSPSSRPSSPNAESSFTAMEGTGGLRYVPEVALLDPRYLQRFAWWTHRAHHNNISGSSVGTGATSHSSGGGAGASTWSSHSPVMSIPGDYLRVVPLQEQDAAIRAVLRFMTHRGRTMDLWEMAQYMQAHGNKSYVYV